MYQLKASFKSGNVKEVLYEIKMVAFVGKNDQYKFDIVDSYRNLVEVEKDFYNTGENAGLHY